MNIWRLIAHHEMAPEAIEIMKVSDRIAIGWSAIGDLRQADPRDPQDITRSISKRYPNLDNAHLGGPSLWNLYAKMDVGDFVILNADGRRVCVFEVTGDYIYEAAPGDILGYSHQRPACLTELEAEELWEKCGADVAEGQNIRWTLAACTKTDLAEQAIYLEGGRFSVTSTTIERNPIARKKCIEHYGCQCWICDYDFESAFGSLGQGFIHVHHRIDLALHKTVHKVDPIKDLIPLCPNCHAMAHREKPAVPIEKLKELYKARRTV
jgi:hypothetical protein